jgi:O-antigen/teichoic acid export membrane protein
MSTEGPVIGARVARNSVWSLTGSLLPAGAVLIASVVMARGLGPEAFGRYVFAVFVYGAAAQVAVWGLPGATSRFLAVARAGGDEDAQTATLQASLRGTLVGTGLATAAVALVALIGGQGVQRSHLLAAAAVVIFLAPTQVLVSVLSGREQFRELAFWQILAGFVNPAATIVAVMLGANVLHILLIDVLVTAGAMGVLLRFTCPLPLRSLRLADTPEGFWRFAWAYTALIVLGVVVFQRSEVLFLERYSTSSAVAMYGVAFGLAQIATRLTGPLMSAVGPALARIAGPSAAAVERRPVQRAFHLSTVVGLAVSGIGWALAPAAIAFLYGEQFAEAARPARLLFLGAWAVAVASVPSGVAQASGRLRPLVIINSLGAVLNIGLDVALIPPLGPDGAALANTGAQSAIAVVLVVWLVRTVPGLSLRSTALGVVPAVCGAMAALAFLALPPLLALIAGGSAGLLAFGVVGRVLGVLDDEVFALGKELARRASSLRQRRQGSTL